MKPYDDDDDAVIDSISMNLNTTNTTNIIIKLHAAGRGADSTVESSLVTKKRETRCHSFGIHDYYEQILTRAGTMFSNTRLILMQSLIYLLGMSRPPAKLYRNNSNNAARVNHFFHISVIVSASSIGM